MLLVMSGQTAVPRPCSWNNVVTFVVSCVQSSDAMSPDMLPKPTGPGGPQRGNIVNGAARPACWVAVSTSTPGDSTRIR